MNLARHDRRAELLRLTEAKFFGMLEVAGTLTAKFDAASLGVTKTQLKSIRFIP